MTAVQKESRFSVKGLIHCHTSMSYDGSIPLDVLCATLSNDGFSFVALTDHTKGLSEEKYRKHVAACHEISTKSFITIPGLEIKLDSGDEILAVGIDDFIASTSAKEVVCQIHEQGGYAIWPHPNKQKLLNLTMHNWDAIEVLNGKMDGTVTPNLSLYWKVRKLQRSGGKLHHIFGADLHNFEVSRSVWTECDVSELSATQILKALHEGRYINHAARAVVPSNGELTFIALGKITLFRIAFLLWNSLLSILPVKVHRLTVDATKNVVEYIKGSK